MSHDLEPMRTPLDTDEHSRPFATTWWLVGDQSETDFRTPEGPVYSCEALERSGGNGCDYLFDPPRLTAGAERAVGVTGR